MRGCYGVDVGMSSDMKELALKEHVRFNTGSPEIERLAGRGVGESSRSFTTSLSESCAVLGECAPTPATGGRSLGGSWSEFCCLATTKRGKSSCVLSLFLEHYNPSARRHLHAYVSVYTDIYINTCTCTDVQMYISTCTHK